MKGKDHDALSRALREEEDDKRRTDTWLGPSEGREGKGWAGRKKWAGSGWMEVGQGEERGRGPGKIRLGFSGFLFSFFYFLFSPFSNQI